MTIPALLPLVFAASFRPTPPLPAPLLCPDAEYKWRWRPFEARPQQREQSLCRPFECAAPPPSSLTSPGLQWLRLSCAGAHGQTSPPAMPPQMWATPHHSSPHPPVLPPSLTHTCLRFGLLGDSPSSYSPI